MKNYKQIKKVYDLTIKIKNSTYYYTRMSVVPKYNEIEFTKTQTGDNTISIIDVDKW